MGGKDTDDTQPSSRCAALCMVDSVSVGLPG